MDHLHALLTPGTPERTNLDRETNYIDFDLVTRMDEQLPGGPYDGILCQHVLEHFELHHAVRVAKMARESLKWGGWFVCSVPDSEYFLKNLDQDTRENAPRIFGEPITPDEPWHKRFFDYAMMHREHKQAFSQSSLTVVLIAAGFQLENVYRNGYPHNEPVLSKIIPHLNRLPFSLVLFAEVLQ